MTDTVTFNLILLTLWLGVMVTSAKSVFPPQRSTNRGNPTSAVGFLSFLSTFNKPALQDSICCVQETSTNSTAMGSDTTLRRDEFKDDQSMHELRNLTLTLDHKLRNHRSIQQTSRAIKGVLRIPKAISHHHKSQTSQPDISTATLRISNSLRERSSDSTAMIAAIRGRRAVIKSLHRAHQSRLFDLKSRIERRCLKRKIFQSTSPTSSRINNSLNLFLYLYQPNYRPSYRNFTLMSLSYSPITRRSYLSRKMEQFMLTLSNKCYFSPSQKNKINFTHRNENSDSRRKEVRIFSPRSESQLSQSYKCKRLLTQSSKVGCWLFISKERSSRRQARSLSNATLKAFIFGKSVECSRLFNIHAKIVPIECYLLHSQSSRLYLAKEKQFSISNHRSPPSGSEPNSPAEQTVAQVRRLPKTTHTQHGGRPEVTQTQHVDYFSTLLSIARSSTSKRPKGGLVEADKIPIIEPLVPGTIKLISKSDSESVLEAPPDRQVRSVSDSRQTLQRSDSITSRQRITGGTNVDGSSSQSSLKPSSVSSNRGIYGLDFDSASSLASWYEARPSPQPVSLKVVVHLSINRGYERVLESAISTGLREREFWPMTRVVTPSGKLVMLKGDRPREILQAFCDDILEPNTTTVFHLVNPFFHSRSWSSAQYVSNLLSTLHMPIITWGPEYIGTTDKKESELLQLNISPTLYHQAHAMLEVLHHYNWTHFCVVYTTASGYDAFITAVRILVNDNNSNVRRNGFKYVIIDEFQVSNSTDNTSIAKDLKLLTKSEARIILLYCIEYETLNIFQEAARLDLVTDEYLWFLTFEAVNKNRNMNANNLPLGLLGIYYEYREEEMEQAIKTAVSVWFRGLQQSVQTAAAAAANGEPTSLPWSMPNLECNSSTSLIWKDGPTFYDIMRNVSFDGVAFNDLGQLKNKDISIVNIQPPVVGEEGRKWRQVGKFTADGIQMTHITWPGRTIHPPLGRPRRHMLRIVTREEPPFVEYRELTKNGTCGHFSFICHVYLRDENEMRISNATVKRCCTGLSIDFLHRLSQSLNFEFHLYEVEDYQWGSETSDGIWDGIVGDLRSGRADMAVASMTIDEDRSKGIDFSVPYTETGITFIVAIREGAISATAFLEPYDYPSWCLILLCSVHITGTSIFFFEWFSPNGLDHGRRLSSNHRFSLFRTFWLMWAMLFGAAVTTDTPRGVSSKFVSNIWALFALVFSASYTANLAAFMITKEEYFDLSGMQDWRLQNPYAMNPAFRFGTIPNGTTESNIKKNNYWMYEYMKKYSQRSVEQAMEALKKQKLHAFIYDASVLEYQEGKDKDCKLITVGNWYSTTGYGVGFPFGSPWLERVNHVILNLQSEGEMERLKEFWLAGACHTKRKKNTNNRGIGNGVSSTTLGILNFTSAFIFLATGTGLAILTFILEYLYFWFGRKRLSSWDKKGCCALISLSMGMSLSFQKSVQEALDIHRKEAHKCTSPICETSLWKANHELRLAKGEISRLQSELARATLDRCSSAVWQYDPISTTRSGGTDHSRWDGGINAHDYRDEEEAARVTLL